eukprot:6212411-Amphidinium_carterae.1
MMQHLCVLRNKLLHNHLSFWLNQKPHGGFTLPATRDWLAQQFGNADTIIPALRADFSIKLDKSWFWGWLWIYRGTGPSNFAGNWVQQS